MPDLTPIQPIAAIIGAIITATAAALVTYYVVVKRKRVLFVIAESKDLTEALHRHHQSITVKIGGHESQRLNWGSVSVRNYGNTSITNFEFEIEIDGWHPICLAEGESKDVKLLKELNVKVPKATSTGAIPIKELEGPTTIAVNIPFFNPKESFDVAIFFNGQVSDCKVNFRMEDVSWKVRSASPWKGVDFVEGPWSQTLERSIGLITGRWIARV